MDPATMQLLRRFILFAIIFSQVLPAIHILPNLPSANAATTSNAVWGTITTLHHDLTASDMTPSMIKLKNGALALVWAQHVLIATEDLYWMMNTGTGWGIPTAVDEGGFAGSSDNRNPSLVQLPNSTLIAFWTLCPLAANGTETSCQIVYNYYNFARHAWTGLNLLTNDAFFNIGPSAEITPNGQLCVFWASDRLNPGIESDIYYTCSPNFGLTWNPDPALGQAPIRMPFSVTGVEDNSPYAVPTASNSIWLTWTSYRSTISPTARNGNLFFTSWNGTYWATPIQLTTDPHDSFGASVAVSNDGGLWMVFQSDRDSTSTTKFTDLYFKRSYAPMNLTSWSTDTRLTFDTNNNWQPSAFPAQSGVIGVAWSSSRPPATSFDIFYDTLTFHNLQVVGVNPTPSTPPGKVMSIAVTVANRGNYTESATLNLYANSSLITPTPVSQPSLGPGLNWTTTYSWNTTGRAVGIYNIQAQVTCSCTEENLSDNSLSGTALVAFRDVGIKSIVIPHYIYLGQTIRVNVTMINEGNVTENFKLMLFYNSTTITIGTATITSLPPKSTTTVPILWNTTNVVFHGIPGGCLISAYIPPLPTETHLSDNNLTASYTYPNCVRKEGDITTSGSDTIANGVVDINDLVAVWQHQFTPYNPAYDPDHRAQGFPDDGAIDVYDLVDTYLHEFT